MLGFAAFHASGINENAMLTAARGMVIWGAKKRHTREANPQITEPASLTICQIEFTSSPEQAVQQQLSWS